MGKQLYGRVYRLEVGLAGQEGREITELQMTFNIEKSLKKNANKATIVLFNLNRTTSGLYLGAKLSKTERRNIRVRLFAGYEGLDGVGIPELLFAGRLGKRGVLIERQPPDTVATLECLDDIGSLAGTSRTRFNRHFEGATTNRTVLDRIIRDTGLARGFIATLPLQTYKSGVTFFGSVEDALTKVTRPAGLSWSIQDGRLQILARAQASAARTVSLTPKTGLIGAPTYTDDGINATALLQPSLVPGGIVEVDNLRNGSARRQGFYRLRNVRHEGDFRGSQWQSSFEGKLLGSTI